jgi:hypothetical protein
MLISVIDSGHSALTSGQFITPELGHFGPILDCLAKSCRVIHTAHAVHSKRS